MTTPLPASKATPPRGKATLKGFVLLAAILAGALVYAGVMRNSAVNILYQVASGTHDRAYTHALGSAASARNELGQNALHVAVAFKREEMLDDLATHGADVNLADNTGLTPLHVAAIYGRATCAQWLLDHGAKLDIRDVFGDTPLHTAAVFGRSNVYRLLLEHGANPAETNKDGRTPLQLAEHYRQTAFLAALDSAPAEAPAQ